MSAMAVNNYLITVYSQHAVNTEIINFSKELCSFKIDFIATDIKRYNTILRWSWIFKIDSDYYFKQHEWYYCKSSINYEIDVTEIFEFKRADASIYIVYLNSVSFMQNAGIELYSIEAVKIQLLKKYKDYTNIFSEEEADKISDFMHIEHLILIKKGKDVLFRSIYSLSANKLYVLHNYLNLSLIKGWVQHSKSSADTSILFVLKKNDGLCLCMNYWGLN